jgi:hypothetical protein
MSARSWFPPDEPTAASTLTVFVEWLRATARLPDADPDAVTRWMALDDALFAEAIAAFAGLDAAAGNAANRLRYAGPREALVLRRGGSRQSWSRDALRQNRPPPPTDLATTLSGGTWKDLVATVAWHLLEAETRPDDRLLWAGDPTDALPFGALACGATLILTDAPADALPAIATGEKAKLLRPPPSDRDAR